MPSNNLEDFGSGKLLGWIAVSIVVLTLGSFAIGELSAGSTLLGSNSLTVTSRSIDRTLTVDENRPMASIDEIKAHLPSVERQRFEEALSDLVTQEMLRSDRSDPEAVREEVHGRLHGMTADEIISLADSTDVGVY